MPAEVKRTPLYSEHLALGARMFAFAGWETPVQYSGIVAEHRAVRTAAGVFDVSHLGRLQVRSRNALPFLQTVVVSDLSRLALGRTRYTLVCRDDGGVLEDLMVYRVSESECLVTCNAVNTEKLKGWLKEHMESPWQVEIRDATATLSMLAVQGPRAAAVIEALGMPCRDLARQACRSTIVSGAEAILSRTGYTAEDGFEFTLEPRAAAVLWRQLIDQGVTPCGLGARDTLRLEGGFLLYGNDMDETTNPYEIGMGHLVHLEKGEFVGRERLKVLKETPPSRKLVGFEMVGRGVARSGHEVYAQGRLVGKVTSGTYAPTLDRNIGLAMVSNESASEGTSLEVDIRGNRVAARVTSLPFYRRPAASS